MRKLLKSFLITAFLLGISTMSNATVPLDQIPSIRVQGNSIIEVDPDQAKLSVYVTNSDPKDAAKARAKTEDCFNSIIKRLKSLNITESDLIAETFTTSKQYNYETKPASVVAYTASRRLNITLNDISLIDSVIDIILDEKSNAEITNIHYTVKDKSKFADQAKKMAVDDSIVQAKKIAGLYNAKVVKVLKINYNQNYDLIETANLSNYGDSVRIMKTNGVSPRQENYFSPKKITINDSVDVIFEIEPQAIN